VTRPSVVALGGGHGLSATLGALRDVAEPLTAVVTVADDGGSSGRLRAEFGGLPPGDLRMALAALCGSDEWGQTWSEVAQHRFGGDGPLRGHAVGNLLIVALWELFPDDPVTGLDWVARLLGCRGRVLPMASTPLQIVADVTGLSQADPTRRTQVHGQQSVAVTRGRVESVHLEPADPPVPPEVLSAVGEADWVVLGPGSWYTSVLPHLLVGPLAKAIVTTAARRAVVLNLEAQAGETSGFTARSYLEALRRHAPGLALDVVIVDRESVADPDELRQAAAAYGAEVVAGDLRRSDGSARHDQAALAAVFRDTFGASVRERGGAG
jgi:uncharacterized cofD-like protein